jgi:hypothetical protein
VRQGEFRSGEAWHGGYGLVSLGWVRQARRVEAVKSGSGTARRDVIWHVGLGE